MPPKRASPSATPELNAEASAAATAAADGSALPDAQWTAMQDILDYIYDYRIADGYDPSKVFHRKVNKRVLPDYYEVIKEPIALSTIKQKIQHRQYKSFAEYVRDFALIPHNAQVYNRPGAGAYQDALVIKEQLQQQFRKLANQGVITTQEAELPHLGEIPPADDLPLEEDEEEEDEDEEDEDDEADEELGEDGSKRRKRGRPRRSDVARRDDKADDPESRKKRGRPPKVLTPTEARIQAVLKGLRKPKNSSGQLKISHFERLPDKAVMPEYFNEIKSPMAYDGLKKKYKRKKYNSLEQFMKDVNLMFENAKLYNQDESQIYKDAVELQVEAQRLAAEEQAKPDTEYAMEEGRMPLPDGILHNGELYKTGDWVLIQNANDLTKPIPTQIYRTWQDSEGGKWVNVCWYYRPEQTVHRFDKHFLENEVTKTGQYRDHRVDEIVGRCFIMFVTRYYKGRPRNLPRDMDIFVCESRYNEEKLTFNKVKTWASCLPDEVRDKDYEMDLFDAPRKMKKFPSPIAYLLKDDQKETDELPKPEWGAENAPPKIGAVHRRVRDPRDSLPPEPTPEPPPQPTPAPNRAMPRMSPQTQATGFSPMPQNTMAAVSQSPVRPQAVQRNSYNASHPQQYAQPTGTPATSQLQRTTSGPRNTFAPATPQIPNMSSHTPAPPSDVYSTQIPPTNPYLREDSKSYTGPPPIEAYTLPTAANLSIPPEIRRQFQQDEYGNILFFTAPPVYQSQPRAADPTPRKSDKLIGHSISYSATKIRSSETVAQHRKEHEAAKAAARVEKRKRQADEDAEAAAQLERLKKRAFEVLEDQLAGAVRGDMEALYGDKWGEMIDVDIERLSQAQKEERRKYEAIERHRRETEAKKIVALGTAGTLMDDY